MALFLTEDDVRVLLDMPTALEAVEESLRRQASGDVSVLPRRRLELPERVFLNDMAAADRKGAWMGVKIYTVAHGKARFVVLLFRGTTGELAAIVEADYLGQMRTGAATGVATRYMSRPDSRVAAIIGTGLQARTQLTAVHEVRKLKTIRAFSRNPDRRADFCQQMTELLGTEVISAASAEEAVRDADVVITATNSVSPVIQSEWLSPGTHINAIGANIAKRKELAAEVVKRAATIAVDSKEQSRSESADLIQVFGEDPAGWANVCELGEIVAGSHPVRKRAEDITLFKSNGIASWDIAAAAAILERAQRDNVGRHISIVE